MPHPIDAQLRLFATTVHERLIAGIGGEPEDQLKGPFEELMRAIGESQGLQVQTIGEIRQDHGKPDYAVLLGGVLSGFVELKAPGKGADPSSYRGHDKRQWERFKNFPNLLYTDGNEWFLWQGGIAEGPIRLGGDLRRRGKESVAETGAREVFELVFRFLQWQPIVPDKAEVLAEQLAPMCHLLRDEVQDSLKNPTSPIRLLASDWRNILFPDADDEQFADAYAQTTTFALLLARSEGADVSDLQVAENALRARHGLMATALHLLTDPQVRQEIGAALRLLQRYISAIPQGLLSRESKPDPWLYFYEDFLAEYDPALRKSAGAYYTPVEVVQCQVRLVHELLTSRLGRRHGFASDDVVTLDPAVGTGTYLLGIIEHALAVVMQQEGPGAVPGRATVLGENLYGFEVMAGPYAVSELRLSRAIQDHDGALPADGPHVLMTDTLESPHAMPPQPPLILQPIATQHERALRVKSGIPVLVCIGNPPYGRHEAEGDDNRSRTGGWVRHGDPNDGAEPILRDFIEPTRLAGHGGDLKNLYNLYVYFWRWALWKVFEHTTAAGPGIVTFISASSYLEGDAFVGMREHIRRQCDEVWIIDVGGEGRGARTDDNVFDILTPVAIAVAFRRNNSSLDTPATVRYSRIEGSRSEKKAALSEVTSFSDLTWQECPTEWHANFRPAGSGEYFSFPALTDLMPWQQSGVKLGRTWPIAPDVATLQERWRQLMEASAQERKALFKDSPTGRKVDVGAPPLPPGIDRQGAISLLPSRTPMPTAIPYSYRSFDRQFLIADARMIDRPSPDLWRVNGPNQLFFVSLYSTPLGKGPGLVATSLLPDLDMFRGSYGAKAVTPLWRDRDEQSANVATGLLEALSAEFEVEITADQVANYIYGVLAHGGYTERFSTELESREIRVPLTRSIKLFERACRLGSRLIWLHTFGDRNVPKGARHGEITKGKARAVKAVPHARDRYPTDFSYDEKSETLRVGDGTFAPVSSDVWEYQVSGLLIIRSWLGYRMKERAGRVSSPLDRIQPSAWTSEFTSELLRLLWVLEQTIAVNDEQAALLAEILEGPLLRALDLPAPLETDRNAPSVQGTLLDSRD